MIKLIARLSMLLVVLFVTGCATQERYDYTMLEASKPRSILVVPPVNNSVEVNASNVYLSTITMPLAEKGYYVFPVAVINQFLQENGLQTPSDMHQVSLEKFNEHLNPDAILYVTIEEWGQQYQVISSSSVVHANLSLVDAKTGQQIWHATAQHIQSSGDGGGGLIGMLVAAAVEQVMGEMMDNTPNVARVANHIAINNQNLGLLSGPYKQK